MPASVCCWERYMEWHVFEKHILETPVCHMCFFLISFHFPPPDLTSFAISLGMWVRAKVCISAGNESPVDCSTPSMEYLWSEPSTLPSMLMWSPLSITKGRLISWKGRCSASAHPSVKNLVQVVSSQLAENLPFGPVHCSHSLSGSSSYWKDHSAQQTQSSGGRQRELMNKPTPKYRYRHRYRQPGCLTCAGTFHAPSN